MFNTSVANAKSSIIHGSLFIWFSIGVISGINISFPYAAFLSVVTLVWASNGTNKQMEKGIGE